MRRGTFVGSLGAGVALGLPLLASGATVVGTRATQRDLVAAPAMPADGTWFRAILADGTTYGKRFGFGSETSPDGRAIRFVETQIGRPEGGFDVDSTRKTYVRETSPASLLAEVAVLASVAKSGDLVTRWADADGGQRQSPRDARLRMLDRSVAYDPAPLVVDSVTREVVEVAGRGHETTRVTASCSRPSRLQSIEVWHAPTVPFGIARYRATSADGVSFEYRLAEYGTEYEPEIGVPLAVVRAMTAGGAAGVLAS